VHFLYLCNSFFGIDLKIFVATWVRGPCTFYISLTQVISNYWSQVLGATLERDWPLAGRARIELCSHTNWNYKKVCGSKLLKALILPITRQPSTNLCEITCRHMILLYQFYPDFISFITDLRDWCSVKSMTIGLIQHIISCNSVFLNFPVYQAFHQVSWSSYKTKPS